MSRWTHITGSLRIDAMPLESDNLWMNEITKKLGKIVRFESPEKDWVLPEDLITPMGSEGGVEYFITVTGGPSSLSRGTVTIWGDLRNFGGNDDSLKILNWLERLDDLKYCYIRQGVIKIDDEGHVGNCVIMFNSELNEFEFFD